MSVSKKIDILIEGGIIDSIGKFAKDKYYDFKGEPSLGDFIKSGNSYVEKDGEMILNPKAYGGNLASQENAMFHKAWGGEDKNPYSGVKAVTKVRDELQGITDDPSVAKEQTDILSAMMKQPVRFSERFTEKGSREPMQSIGVAEQDINSKGNELAQRIQNSSEMHHLGNKGSAAIMSQDKLDSLDQHQLYRGDDAMEHIKNFDFI